MILINQEAIIISKKNIAENTMEVTFAISGGEFSFMAGQYITVCIPSLVGESVPNRCHDFSIATSPSKSDEIAIAFRVSQSVFKSALAALPLGSVVQMDGPKGVFTLPEPSSNVPDLIFIAGGIGITPILSMLRYVTEVSSPQKITLLYFNTSREKSAYREEILMLQKINKHLSIIEILGVPSRGNFDEVIQSSSDKLWYVVGVPEMVVSVRNILLLSGILSKQIKFEEFSGYEQ